MKKLAKVLVSALVLVMICFTLVACAPLSIDSAEEKMEKAGYLVIEEDYDKDENEKVAGFITATKLGDTVTATLYRKTSDAKEAFEALGGDKDSDRVKRSGKWVIVGTKDAVEDFLD